MRSWHLGKWSEKRDPRQREGPRPRGWEAWTATQGRAWAAVIELDGRGELPMSWKAMLRGELLSYREKQRCILEVTMALDLLKP